MKKYLFTFFTTVLLISGHCIGQTKTIGWYHLLEGAQTMLLDNWVDQNKVDVGYGSNEVLLVFDFKGQKGYAIDVDGRAVQIQDMSKTRKIDTAGRVVKLTRDIDVSLNNKLTRNNNVWLIGFNPVNNSAKVLLASGEIVEIPKDSYIDIRDQLDLKWAYVYKVKDVVAQ